MLYYYYIIFYFLIIFIKSDQCDKFTNIPSSVNECQGQLSDTQIKDDLKSHCCYYKSDNDILPKCISLTKIQYDNIKDYIKFNEILWGEVNLKIDCYSFYLKIGLLNLILLFL